MTEGMLGHLPCPLHLKKKFDCTIVWFIQDLKTMMGLLFIELVRLGM